MMIPDSMATTTQPGSASGSLREQIEQQKALAGVISRIRRPLDLNLIFEITATEVRQLLKADRVGVFRFDPAVRWQGEFVSEDVAPGLKSAIAAKVHDHCFGDQFAAHYAEGRIQAVADIYDAGLSHCHVEILSQFQVRANLAVPLLNGDILWGLLCVHQCSAPRSWQTSEIEFIKQIAEHFTVAIQQAEYIHRAQTQATQLAQAAQRQQALAATVDKIRQSLDLDTIFQTTTQEVRQLLAVDRVAIFRFNSDWSGEFVAESVAPGWIPLADVQPFIADVHLQETQGGRYSQHETFTVDDIYQQGLRDCHIALLDRLQAKAFIIVPIFEGDKLWGLMGAYQNTSSREWQAHEVELLAQIGTPLGVAIQQAELLGQTQRQAVELTQTLKALQQTQTQLIQGEKMAGLGQLVAGVAHEINNPINFISGNLTHIDTYTQNLLSLVRLYQAHYPIPEAEIEAQLEKIGLDFVMEDCPKLLDSMRMGTDRILHIVLSLRNFSRLDEAERKQVDLHEGIDSTLLILGHHLKATSKRPQIEVIKHYGALPRVECYPAQLNQVFLNILKNGIDALEASYQAQLQSQLRLEIHTEVSKNRAIVRIIDNGIGISEAVRPRIFDPFFTTKEPGQGTGLGLSISYQIVVQKHKGKLKCLPQVGQGTEFRIEIPL